MSSTSSRSNSASSISRRAWCFLGGTGAGRSLVLESVRFALDQQVDRSTFKGIRDEVDLRLAYALRDGTEGHVHVRVDGETYRVRRAFDPAGSTPIVEQDSDGDWVEIARDPATLLSIAAFSQGEILEYARQPVGRVGLIDAALDLFDIDDRIEAAEDGLAANARALIAARKQVAALTQEAGLVTGFADRERELSLLFDPDLVKAQGLWTTERGELKTSRRESRSIAV